MISSQCRVAVGLLGLTLLGLFGSAAFAETVKVEGGLLQGTIEDGLRVFHGIPYAAPPVGDLRWRPPQSPSKWDGVRVADQFGRACIQTNAAIADLPAPSEDCLYLNVWTPAKRVGRACPFWFGFMGAASWRAHRPRSFTTANGWLRKG